MTRSEVQNMIRAALQRPETLIRQLQGTVDGRLLLPSVLIQAGGALLGSSPNATRGFGLTGLTAFSSLTTNPMLDYNLVESEFAVPGKTAKLAVSGTCKVNATAPGAGRDFTLGLYPISSVAGASGGVTYTAGTVVLGSTFAFNGGTDLAASTRYASTVDGVAFPSSGPYCLALAQTGGAVAAASHLHFTARLFIYHE